VTEVEIRHVIEQSDLATVRQVTHACGAGGGCTACHRHIKRYLHDAQRRAQQTADCPLEVVLGYT
jgi:bacterioferritin-associated ferredoxin